MNSLEKQIAYANAIIKAIDNGEINTLRDLDIKQFLFSKKFNLSAVPTRPFVLSQSKNSSKKVKSLLSIKPTRSLSGVSVIAVMLPPFPCPGKCVYCPSSFVDKKAPQSYTGFEPSTLRAQRFNFDSYKIVRNRIEQLDATGNNADKIELIFQGSSFTALSKVEQDLIVKNSIDAVTQVKSKNILEAKKNALKSKRRIVGITFETRPDICSKNDINQMLNLGGTRIELGVQNPSDEIYKKIKRGHTVKDVVVSTRYLKDSAFKILYHLMPGLPGSDFKTDLKNFRQIFTDDDFKPDMVKFYPCLVIKGTQLYNDWKKGNFDPMTEEKAIKLLVNLKEEIPPWVRIMRVNRDIPSTVISAGVKKTNLRQLVESEMKSSGKKCNCIRCREIGLKNRNNKNDFLTNKPKIQTIFYNASKGQEAFISLESKDGLYGFVRLRKPFEPFIKPIDNSTALIRELHVFGKAMALGNKDLDAVQHKGYGKILLDEAEKIAKEKFDSKKIVVISGIGVREYYKKFGYKTKEPFVFKKLVD